MSKETYWKHIYEIIHHGCSDVDSRNYSQTLLVILFTVASHELYTQDSRCHCHHEYMSPAAATLQLDNTGKYCMCGYHAESCLPSDTP